MHDGLLQSRFVQICILLMAIACFAMPAARAVTQTPQAWTTNVVAGTFPSKEAALAAVRALGGVYALAENVESLRYTSAGVTYTYGSYPRPPDIGPWEQFTVQHALTNPHPSEESAVASVLAWTGQNAPGCGGGSVVTQKEWYPWKYFFSSGIESESTKFFTVTYYRLPGCSSGSSLAQAWRVRSVACPAGLTWNTTDKACVAKGIATISSRSFPCSDCDQFHNPVDVGTGGKFQREPDLTLPWISFTRYFHSTHSLPGSGFGGGWTHSLNIRFYPGADGQGLLVDGRGATVGFQSYESKDGAGWTFSYSAAGYQVETPDATWLFEAQKISKITYRDGQFVVLEYDGSGRVSTAKHSSGRALAFTWDPARPGDPRIQSIQQEGVEHVRYHYDDTGRLSAVHYAGAQARGYHYESANLPMHLTGVTDESGQRVATYEYDTDGRVVVSEHAGGVFRGVFQYLPNGHTTYEDANGRVRTFAFDALGPVRKISGVTDASGTSTAVYEPVSNFRRRPLERVDAKGIRTTYAYVDDYDSTFGNVRTTTVTEAAGTPDARVTRSVRERTAATLVRQTVGGRETTYVRNARRQPVTVTERELASGRTRTTTTTYCEQPGVDVGTCPLLGLVLSVDGPRTEVSDMTTYQYYPSDHPDCATTPASCAWRKADLWKVTSASGQTTETLRYDSAGRPLSVRDPNGVITDFEYHPRGWLLARKVRAQN